VKPSGIAKWSCVAKVGIFAVAILILRPSFAQDTLPRGWRKPTLAEAGADWRKKSPTRFLAAKGDFDGDGKQDVAELLVDISGKHFGLFIKRASAPDWLTVDGAQGEVKDLANFGIDLVKPGKYKTACGKGYGDYACSHGEPEVLELSRPAVDYFYNESSDFIFYWDAKGKKFIQIQMSD
jgi:hypothetical protein